MSITFGQVGEMEGKPAVVDQATISFAPALARAIVAVLLANIKGYEEQFGEIKMPRGFGGAKKRIAQQENELGATAAEPEESKSK